MKEYHLSIRCYFEGYGNYTTHYRDMDLKDIKKWVEAYKLTHPMCKAITVKIYLDEEAEQGANEE